MSTKGYQLEGGILPQAFTLQRGREEQDGSREMELEGVCDRKKERKNRGAGCYHLKPSLALFTEGSSGKGQCTVTLISPRRQHALTIATGLNIDCSVSLTPDQGLTADRHSLHEVWAESQIDLGTEGQWLSIKIHDQIGDAFYMFNTI